MTGLPPGIRLVVADDEPAVRDDIIGVLQGVAGVQVVAAASNGLDALEAIRTMEPDGLFLDVQMPGLTGLEVLAALDPQLRPPTVFVTAYDTFAVRAFELHALDYVLKPFDDTRILAALERLQQRIRAETGVAAQSGGELELALRAFLEAAPLRAERFIVNHGGRLRVVPVKDIDWVESAGNYVRLYAGGGSSLLRESMHAIAERLDPKRFVRVHRTVIVNMSRVRELAPLPNGDYEITLSAGVKVPMSRTYRDTVLERLGR